MRVISATALTALAAGRFRVRALLHVLLPGNQTFAIWDDLGSITVSGIVYAGAPGRFQIAPLMSVGDLSQRNVDVTLSGLDTASVSLIDGVGWHQAPIIIQRAIITEDAPGVVHLMPYFTGFLDGAVRKERPDGTSTLTFRCEASARELSRKGARTRSDADQRQRDPSDGFFKFTTSAVVTNIAWGSVAPSQPPVKRKKFLGIF